MVSVTPQCLNCTRYVEGNVCTVFPAGIPDDIWLNYTDHRQPAKGDHGVTYQQKDPSLPHPLEKDEEDSQ